MECSNQYNQQPINECSLSKKKTRNHDSKVSNSVTETTMDLIAKETTSPTCHRVTKQNIQKNVKLTQYEKSVLEAYGILPVQLHFPSFPRKCLFHRQNTSQLRPASNVKAISRLFRIGQYYENSRSYMCNRTVITLPQKNFPKQFPKVLQIAF